MSIKGGNIAAAEEGDKGQRCDNCKADIIITWKYCGKCGAFLMPKMKALPATVKSKAHRDAFKDSFNNTISAIKTSQMGYTREKQQLGYALTVMEVDNGLRTEDGYSQLQAGVRKKGVWEKPTPTTAPKKKERNDESHYKPFTYPIRPPRRRVNPLNYSQHQQASEKEAAASSSKQGDSEATDRNDEIKQDEKGEPKNKATAEEERGEEKPGPSTAWFWGEAKFSDKVPINALWYHPRGPQPPPPEPEPEPEPVDETAEMKAKEEKDIAMFLNKLDAWPNVMGKRFRGCVHSMRNSLKLCDVNVIDFQSRGRIKHLTGIIESLLHNIHQTKNTTHVINQEQMLFYSELEEFRIQITASLAGALNKFHTLDAETVSSNMTTKSTQKWDLILSETVEDKQRDEIDTILRLR